MTFGPAEDRGSGGAAARPGAGSKSLLLVVFATGTSTLGAEIATARLLAPYFGASTIVWANTIGIVLVALSAGYWQGGKLADRDPSVRGLQRIILLGGVLLALVPFMADPFLGVAVDALDAVSAGAFLGSLVGVTVLVSVPIFLLGAVSPYALRLAVDRLDEAGRVAGRLFAISTVGSLFGTFLSALVLIPLVGTRRTFVLFGLSLVVAAALGLRGRAPLAAVAALLVLLVAPLATTKPAKEGRSVIFESETAYQYARVVEHDGSGDRFLELNEGQAVHSVRRRGSYLTGGIWDEFLVAPFAGLMAPPGRVAILGNAAGTVARAYGHYFPRTRIDGVEIDVELTRIGEELFDLRNPRLELFAEDARPYLRRTSRRYDAIFIDAYRQPYIPFYLATREFFELVRDRLEAGGVAIVNAGHPEGSPDLERALAATIRTAFPTVLRDPAEDTNTLLIAGGSDLSAARLRRAATSLPRDLQGRAVAAARRVEPAFGGGTIFTDDRAPVEWLIDTSIVEIAAKGAR